MKEERIARILRHCNKIAVVLKERLYCIDTKTSDNNVFDNKIHDVITSCMRKSRGYYDYPDLERIETDDSKVYNDLQGRKNITIDVCVYTTHNQINKRTVICQLLCKMYYPPLTTWITIEQIKIINSFGIYPADCIIYGDCDSPGFTEISQNLYIYENMLIKNVNPRFTDIDDGAIKAGFRYDIVSELPEYVSTDLV